MRRLDTCIRHCAMDTFLLSSEIMEQEIAKLKFHNKALLMMLQDVMNGSKIQHSEHFAIIMFDLSKQDLRQIVAWIRDYQSNIDEFCEQVCGLNAEIGDKSSVQLMIECLKNSHILPEKCQQILQDLAE